MGLLGDVLGDDHFLNQPNSVYGIAAYLMIIGLGKCVSSLHQITLNSTWRR